MEGPANENLVYTLPACGDSWDAVSSLLAERGKTHGDFTTLARITQELKGAIHSHTTPVHTPVMVEALEMIAYKIGRILAGDPNHRDHWDDIAGYAKLAADRCK